MSTGEALRDQPLYIGIYTRQAELYNGEAVYIKVIISFGHNNFNCSNCKDWGWGDPLHLLLHQRDPRCEPLGDRAESRRVLIIYLTESIKLN